jgi:hypothetical protein
MKKIGLAVLTAFLLIPAFMYTAYAQTPQEKGYLGVSIQNITEDLVKSLNLKTDKGVMVNGVVEGGPADKAGLKKGDVIVTFDGREPQDSRDLTSIVAATPVDKEVRVRINREGMVTTLVIKLGKLEPKEVLNRYVADLQKNPNDNALREIIIKFAQTMKPGPAMPEEARRHFVEAGALLAGASDKRGAELAIAEYRQALLAAPWWPEAYYNYAVALELAERYDDAASVLKLYIKTNPSENDARKALDKVYVLEAKKKLAAVKETIIPQPIPQPPPSPIAKFKGVWKFTSTNQVALTVTEMAGQQWRIMAQDLDAEVREVNAHRLFVVTHFVNRVTVYNFYDLSFTGDNTARCHFWLEGNGTGRNEQNFDVQRTSL